jgi:D-glucosaminate-6-phosphate ammonia-lyase
MHRANRWARVTRREVFYGSAGAGALGLLGAGRPSRAAELEIGREIYQSLGVRPLINARGTVTIVTGSQTLPEVKAAMDAASRHFVQMDELMEAVGKRLAELTGAEWGIVTTGAAGSLTLATCACIAGGDPDKLELLPYQSTIPGMKSEVIIPRSSRNVYDHSVRAAGVRIMEPENMEQLEYMIGPQTAMIMLLSGASEPLSLESVAPVAKQHRVPLMVDAAAEELRVPNPHLSRGADLVGYSGGKCIRGPQCAGLLLGRKDLVQAAWIHSAPHHSICRALKAGKEEIVGMLAAVEMWFKRDHAAEEKTWEGWLEEISASVKRIDGITTEIIPARGINNRSPRLRITWDRAKIDLIEDELEQKLYDGDPRIAVGGAGSFLPFPPDTGNSVSISPYQMMPGEAKIVADRLYKELSSAPKPGWRKKPAAPAVNLTGQWDVTLKYVYASGDCRLVLEQKGNNIIGTHYGMAAKRDVAGTIDGNNVLLRSSYLEHGARLNFTFRGIVENDTMNGSAQVGEYGNATFVAKRHHYITPDAGRRG